MKIIKIIFCFIILYATNILSSQAPFSCRKCNSRNYDFRIAASTNCLFINRLDAHGKIIFGFDDRECCHDCLSHLRKFFGERYSVLRKEYVKKYYDDQKKEWKKETPPFQCTFTKLGTLIFDDSVGKKEQSESRLSQPTASAKPVAQQDPASAANK